MTTHSLLTVPANSTVLATFGTSHGYRFDADTVALTASFNVRSPLAHQRNWTLQLWACPSAPTAAREVQGQLVATASLPPLAEIADPVETFTVNAVAVPPAGQREQTLVLALVAAAADGRSDGEIHDLVVYPRREIFTLPRLIDGAVADLRDGHVILTAGAIENPRDGGNLSGSLSLELWALPSAYNGGDFTGSPIAGAVLGSLAGQSRWTGLHISLVAKLPQQNAQLVLMLREWNGVTYLTRDFVNLIEPFIAPVSAAKSNASAKATKPAKRARKSAASKKVSINLGTEVELAAVKKLSHSIARAIIAGRPFTTINDLIKVKGMGPKLLAKVRSHLRLN